MLELCGLRGIRNSEASLEVSISRPPFLPPETARPLEGCLAPWGSYAIEGDTILAHIPDDPYAAEAVLRIAYQHAIGRQGGFLIHASGVCFDGVAFLATGPSGSGKSTLARLAVEAGGTLLSDEIIGVLPDGRICGTPFRSDLEIPGSPSVVRLGQVLLLEKAPSEALKEVPGAEAVAALLSQAFRPLPEGMTTAGLFKLLARLVESPGVKRLAFRKHAEAGKFVASMLSATPT